jgi:cell division septation protein DedD
MFIDREQATDKLEAAKGYYQKAEAAPNDPNLVARARLGLGKVNEALCQPEEALKYYKQVAETQKDTAIGKEAARAAKRMENPRDVALLAWFAQQTPKKPAPLPGIGSGLPGLPNDLPDRPDITPPSGLGLDNLGTGIPESPEPTLPQPGTTPPTTPEGEKPEATKPAATTPESSKPADAGEAKPSASEAKPAKTQPE